MGKGNDLVMNLLLKTGGFSNDIKTAKREIQDFKNNASNAGKSVQGFSSSLGINIGVLGKLGSAIGIATSAGAALKKIIDSSQTTADKYAVVMGSATTVIDNFASALARADFTAFNQGLDEMWRKANKAIEALDQLGNTEIAFNFMSSKYRTRANELYNIINNPEATKEAKTKAHAELKKLIDELNEYASNYAAQIRNTYKTKVASKSDLHISQITYAQFEKAMKIDLSDDPASARASINAQYNQYKSKLAEYGDNNVMGQVALKKRYEDVIAIYTMLEIFTDEELTQLGQLMQKEEQARQTAQAIEKMSNRTSKTVSKLETTSTTSTTASHETSKAVEGSIRWINEQIKVLEDQRDTLATTTAEIQKYNAQIGQLELQKRKLINGELSPITPLPAITSKVTTTSETGIIQPKSVEQVTDALYDQYDVLSSISSISSSIGSIFSAMGNETSSAIGGILQSSLALIEALMQFPAVQQAMVAASNVATTTQIGNSMAVIGAKQAESLASGTASAASLPFPANLAAIAGVIAAIVGIFSSIKSVGNFATGGIVGGSSFFGDRITANVNSGEMILNGRQQRQLWEMANGNTSTSNPEIKLRISGSDLVGVMSNVNSRYNKIR